MNIVCLGDSLMQPNTAETYPQEGWPQELALFLMDPAHVQILNYALNGRSSKSFIEEGHFVEALEAAQEGDVVFISFGHNDEKKEDPSRYAAPFLDYQENLLMMARSFERKGAKVVFITSMSRLKYDTDGNLLRTHGDYPRAMKEVAKKNGYDCVDLESLSYEDLSQRDFIANKDYFMCLPKGVYPNFPEGLKDTSHLQANGAKYVIRLLLPEFKKISYLKGLFV